MRILAIVLGLAATSSASFAQTTLCQATTWCDDELICTPTDGVLEVVRGSDGTVTLEWQGAVPFDAELLQDAPTTVIVDAASQGTGLILVIGSGGEAIYTTATDFDGDLISGVYALTCEVAK